MPTVNVGWRDLAGCRIDRVEAVLNGTTQGILRAMEQGVAYAERAGDDYRLSVRPTALLRDHPLARMSGDEMGIVYYTDISGRLNLTTRETDPVPTAAAMLRDAIEIVTR